MSTMQHQGHVPAANANGDPEKKQRKQRTPAEKTGFDYKNVQVPAEVHAEFTKRAAADYRTPESLIAKLMHQHVKGERE